MPLPFAPPPSQSKVYADLKNIKLDDLTSDQFDALKGEVYAQGVDGAEDEYRRLLLLGLAADKVSVSGVIPGTMAFHTNSFSAAAAVTVLQPGVGEIWRVFQPVARTTAGSITGTPDYEIWIEDDETSVDFRVFYMASTSTKPVLTEDASMYGFWFEIGYGQSVKAELGGSGLPTTIVFGVLAGRTR